jgi:hypothetical protein
MFQQNRQHVADTTAHVSYHAFINVYHTLFYATS